MTRTPGDHEVAPGAVRRPLNIAEPTTGYVVPLANFHPATPGRRASTRTRTRTSTVGRRPAVRRRRSGRRRHRILLPWRRRGAEQHGRRTSHECSAARRHLAARRVARLARRRRSVGVVAAAHQVGVADRRDVDRRGHDGQPGGEVLVQLQRAAGVVERARAVRDDPDVGGRRWPAARRGGPGRGRGRWRRPACGAHRADEHDRRRRQPRRHLLDERDVDPFVPRPGEHDTRAGARPRSRRGSGAAAAYAATSHPLGMSTASTPRARQSATSAPRRR